MNEQNPWVEKRAYVRIQRKFITRYRDHEAQESLWEFPVIKDISQAGCYFYSSIECKVGQQLDIEIQLPRLMEPMQFVGEVLRVEDESEELQRYGVAVKFMDMDDSKKDIFVDTLNFFIQREKKQEG